MMGNSLFQVEHKKLMTLVEHPLFKFFTGHGSQRFFVGSLIRHFDGYCQPPALVRVPDGLTSLQPGRFSSGDNFFGLNTCRASI